jgi:hypothetical protein
LYSSPWTSSFSILYFTLAIEPTFVEAIYSLLAFD